MRIFHFLLFCCISISVDAQTHLIVHPDGHKGMIRDLIVTGDKKSVVTASFDKSILQWDIETGEVIRQFRSHIGKGSEGMVYAIALSPDEKFLATGGWYGDDDGSENLGDIRVFDFLTGKIAFVLKGHVNVIHDLAFTPDGKFLISSDAEGDLIQWNIQTASIEKKYTYDKEAEVLNLVTNGKYFATGDQLGNVLLWETGKPKPVKKDKYFQGYQIRDVAVSPDGMWYAASGERFIMIYDKNLKRVAEINNEEIAAFLKFSPDSKKLIAGTTTTGKIHHVNVYEFEEQKWKHLTSFNDHKSSVLCGGFITNEICVSAGGEDDEICTWKINKSGTSSVIKKMVGVGQSGYAASMKDKRISFASMWSANFGMSEFDKSFDLLTRKWLKPDKSVSHDRPVTERGEYKLRRARQGKEMEDLNAKLYLSKGDKILDSVIRNDWNGSRHNVFSFIPGKYFVSGGSYGILTAHDFEGNIVSRFVGHEGDIWGLAISMENDRMISISSDQTIRIWDLSNVDKYREPSDMPSVWDYCIQMEVHQTFHKIFGMHNLTSQAKRNTYSGWKNTIAGLKSNGYPVSFLENKLSDLTSNFIYPIASVFLSRNGEWIIWNNDGYFTASKKGAKYVGYHLNQGKDKEAKFYPFEQFDLKYNRPDIILKDLSLASDKVIQGYYNAYKKRLRKMGITEEQLGNEIHIPEISVLSKEEKANELTFTLNAFDHKFKLDRIIVYVNDVPVFGRKGKMINGRNISQISEKISVPLISGKNKIQVSVINEKGVESYKETFYSVNNSPDDPELYLVSIGVSKYTDKKYDLRYAAKDAKDISALFASGKIFSKTHIKELTDEQVTRENVKRIRDEFLVHAKPSDIVMIFVAGHGVLDENLDFYFATSDMNFLNPASKGIPYEELESLLDGIKALRKMLFMDSCHSGEVDKDEVHSVQSDKISSGDIVFRQAGPVGVSKRVGLENSEIISKDLFSDINKGTGAMVISSAGGVETAMESSQWKNGLFTFCLINGIRSNAADLNRDEKISISELQQYVRDEVYRLSGGMQEPTYRKENLEFDFRIW